MKPADLASRGMDLWLLGHTHIRHPRTPTARDRIFIAGTPEPDGFDCAHAGSAWIIRVEDGGGVKAEALTAGSYSFRHESVELRVPADITAFTTRLLGTDGKHVLLKAAVSGRLPPESRAELEEARRKLAAAYFQLLWDEEGLREEITQETIEREFSQGSFPHRLLSDLARGGDAEALEIAWDLLHEARE